MSRTPHIIEQQFLEVTFTDRREGMGLQDQLAAIYKEKVLPLLETVLNDHDLPNHTIQIDEITIDAGVLSSKNWEQELVERSVQQFKAILQKKLLSPWPRHSTQQQPQLPVEEGVQWLPEAVFHYNRFIEFVSTGTMPVSDNRHTIQQTITVLLNNKADWQTAANRVVVLRLLYTNQQALERLLRQCGDIVEEIVRWLNEQPIQEASIYTILSAIPDLYTRRLWLSSLVLIKKAQQQLSLITALHKSAPIRLLQALIAHNKEQVRLPDIVEKLDPQVANLLIDTNEPFAITIKEENRPAPRSPKEEQGNKMAEDRNKEKESVEAGVKKETQQEGAPVHLYNAGLIILHPFLLPFFSKTGLIDKNNQWTGTAAHQRAVLLTQYLVTGEEKIPEFYLPLNKLLCGYPMRATLDDQLELTAREQEEATALLSAVIEHWGALKSTGIEALRISFLQRAGKLMHTEKGWHLVTEQKSFDILMQSLPWGIGRIKTPWMEEWLLTDWT